MRNVSKRRKVDGTLGIDLENELEVAFVLGVVCDGRVRADDEVAGDLRGHPDVLPGAQAEHVVLCRQTEAKAAHVVRHRLDNTTTTIYLCISIYFDINHRTDCKRFNLLPKMMTILFRDY